MAEDGEAKKPGGGDAPTKEGNKAGAEASAAQPPAPPAGFPSVSLSIWPPSQRTREAVIQHLIETLSSSSVLSKRYGVIPLDDASAVGRRIEEEAFSEATASAGDGRATSVDDEVEVTQIYSKEISKRVMVTVKEKGSFASAPSSIEDGSAK